MEYSFLFLLVQKLRKSIKKCKTYSRKATGLFFSRIRCISLLSRFDTDMPMDKMIVAVSIVILQERMRESVVGDGTD